MLKKASSDLSVVKSSSNALCSEAPSNFMIDRRLDCKSAVVRCCFFIIISPYEFAFAIFFFTCDHELKVFSEQTKFKHKKVLDMHFFKRE